MSLSYTVFLFYAFEVPSQLEMISCTRLLHEFLKVQEDHTAIVRSPHGLRTRAARGRATTVRFLCTAAETAR